MQVGAPPPHAAQAAPRFPHLLFDWDANCTQVSPSQQPPKHVVALQGVRQTPALQTWPAMHDPHDFAPVPQLVTV